MIELLGIKQSKHSTDGRLVSVTFETNAGPTEFVSNASALRGILQQLAMILWDARKASPEPEIMSAPVPKKFQARPTKNRQAVMLHFVMENELETHIALANEDAERLQAQIQKALSLQK